MELDHICVVNGISCRSLFLRGLLELHQAQYHQSKLEPNLGSRMCYGCDGAEWQVAAPSRTSQTFANFADSRVKAAFTGRSIFRRVYCNREKESAGRTGIVVWIAFGFVYILSLYAIIFSSHAILKTSLTHGLPRGQDKEDLPVLFFQLLHQWVVDLGVQRCQNTFVRDRTV